MKNRPLAQWTFAVLLLGRAAPAAAQCPAVTGLQPNTITATTASLYY